MGVFKQIKSIVKQIPKGKVTTYGEIAKTLGLKDVRLVGWALHQNKNPKIPCHRVVNKNGRIVPGYVFGGQEAQKRKLEKEEVKFKNETHVDLTHHLWQPKVK